MSTLDTFVFNDAQSSLNQTWCYDVLENIKDGRSIASKHSSEIIQFKTPNFVIAFSNAYPCMTQLSKDRWKVFYINEDGPSNQEKRLWELRSSKKRSHYCRRFPLYWKKSIEIVWKSSNLNCKSVKRLTLSFFKCKWKYYTFHPQ